MRKLLLCVALYFSPAVHGAQEHAACTNTGYDWFTHTAGELRGIASACSSERFSELNFQRAYFRDLVAEGDATSSLIDYARSESRASFSAFVFHMILKEQLARHYYPTTAGQLMFLNREYEINNEIAELWLRGYNNLATRLTELHSNRETDSEPLR